MDKYKVGITKVEVVVGYMYKVQKQKMDTSQFAKEFAAIRHGNYFQFFNLIEKEIDFIVTYSNGQISTNRRVVANESAFGALLKTGDCLKDFYRRIYHTYGEFNDTDLSDRDFERAAYFELSVRMHSNNKLLPSEEIKLIDVINNLRLTTDEKNILHHGRKFINQLKRPWKMKTNWNTELNKFNLAFQLLLEKQLTII
jgi:hypothetical protein